MDHEFIVYTDGASRKDRRGGWAFTVWFDGQWWDQFGGCYDTTNGRMELQAVVSALQHLDGMAEDGERLTIQIWADAKYVIDGVTEYLEDWVFRNWRTSGNKPVKNQDLWVQLRDLNMKHDVEWQWVKGHSGVEGNERADKLADQGVPPPVVWPVPVHRARRPPHAH